MITEDRQKVKEAIHEISNSMFRTEAERDLIKDIVAKVAEEHGLDKKMIKRLATVYHKQCFNEEIAVHEEFETLYQEVVNPNPSE